MKHQQAATHATHEVAKKNKKNASAPKSADAVDPKDSATDDRRIEIIRRTAYSFFEARNFEDGHELDDWLQAEAQVASMTGQSAKDDESVRQTA
jgi:hypothetical protein